MTIRLAIIASVFSIAGIEALHSEDAIAPELARLKTSYQSAVTKAVTPLTTAYRKELEKLMDTFTRAGKLDQALQVKKELATLDSVSLAKSEQDSDTKGIAPTTAPVTSIEGTVWIAKTGFLRRLEFRAKGAMTVTNENNKVYTAFTYKPAQDGSFVITTPAEPTKPGTFRFTNQGAVLEGIFEKKTFKLETSKQ